MFKTLIDWHFLKAIGLLSSLNSKERSNKVNEIVTLSFSPYEEAISNLKVLNREKDEKSTLLKIKNLLKINKTLLSISMNELSLLSLSINNESFETFKNYKFTLRKDISFFIKN